MRALHEASEPMSWDERLLVGPLTVDALDRLEESQAKTKRSVIDLLENPQFVVREMSVSCPTKIDPLDESPFGRREIPTGERYISIYGWMKSDG